MSIKLKTRKMLWGQSASRCSFPSCRITLVEDESETDDPSLIGDEAHIVARSPDGPRGDSELTSDERDLFQNLILMCKNHHKVIDDQEDKYSVEALHQMKLEHLDWVNQALDIDKSRLKDEEVYATYVDRWQQMADLDGWDNWSSFVLGSGQPRIRYQFREQLEELNRYLVSRIWPRRYLEIERSFNNFAKVLNDFRSVFDTHAVERGGDENTLWVTEKFYQIREYDEQRYNELLSRFNYHVDLVQDLMLELTRAANRICAAIRLELSSSYRINEGILLVTSGPHMDMSYKTRRTEYLNGSEDNRTYPGLRSFMVVRESRDIHFGSGVDESYFVTYD